MTIIIRPCKYFNATVPLMAQVWRVVGCPAKINPGKTIDNFVISIPEFSKYRST